MQNKGITITLSVLAGLCLFGAIVMSILKYQGKYEDTFSVFHIIGLFVGTACSALLAGLIGQN